MLCSFRCNDYKNVATNNSKLQSENRITICICDHQARDLLTCVDVAVVLSEGKVIAKGTPSELVKNPIAQTAYFGESFKFN